MGLPKKYGHAQVCRSEILSQHDPLMILDIEFAQKFPFFPTSQRMRRYSGFPNTVP